MYEKFNMRLHDPSWNPTCMQSFRFELFMVFEIQGHKLNKKKKNNWEYQLFVISPLFVMYFLPYFRYTCMSPITGHDAEKPRPSLYTKYYCTL